MLIELQNILRSYNIPLKLIEQMITLLGSNRLGYVVKENRALLIDFIKILYRPRPTPGVVLNSYLRTTISQRTSPFSFKEMISAIGDENAEELTHEESESHNETIDLVDSRFREAYSRLAEPLKSFQRRFVDMSTDNPDNNRDLFEHWLIHNFVSDAFIASLHESPLKSTKKGIGGNNGRRYLSMVGLSLKEIKKTATAQLTEKLKKFSPQEYADREKAKEKAKSISRRLPIQYWNTEYRKLLLTDPRPHCPLCLVKGLTDIILTHEATVFFMVLKKYTHASVHKSLDDFEQRILSTMLLSTDDKAFSKSTSKFISDMMFFNHRMEVLIANYDHSLLKLSPHGSDIYFKFLSLTEGMTDFFKHALDESSHLSWMQRPRLLHLEQSITEMEESFSRNLHTLMSQESRATAAHIMQQLDHLRSLKSIPETHIALFKLLRHYSSVRGKEPPKFESLKKQLVRKHKPVMWIAGQQERLIRMAQNALSWENQPANWIEDNILLREMENTPLYSLEIFHRSTLRPVPNFIHDTSARHNQYGVLKEPIPGHDTAFEEGNANSLWNSIRYTMLKNLRFTIEHSSSQQLRDKLGSRHNNVITLINNQIDHVLSHIDTPIDTTEEEPELFIFVQDLCRVITSTEEDLDQSDSDSSETNSDQSTHLCHQLMDSLKAQSQQVKENMEAIRTDSASTPDKPAAIQIDLPEEMLELLELVNSGILHSLLRQEVMFQIRTIMPSVSQMSNALALIEFTQGASLYFRRKSNTESTVSAIEKRQLSVTYNLAQRIYSEWMYRIEASYAERLGEMQREGKPIESDFMDALNRLRQSDTEVLSYITERIKEAIMIKLREVQQTKMTTGQETDSKSGLSLITESMDRVIQDLKSEKQKPEDMTNKTHMTHSPSQEPRESVSLLSNEATYSLQEKLETVTILREYFALVSRVHHGETLSTKEINEFWLVRAGRFSEDHGGVSYVMWFMVHIVMTISRYLSELNAVSTAEYPSGGTLPVGSTHFPWVPDLGIDWLSAVMSTWAQGVALLSIAPLLSDNSQTNEMLKACKEIPWALSGPSSEFMCHAVQHYLALSAEDPLDSKSTPEQVYYHYASSWDRFNDFLSALSLKYLSPEYNFVGDSWWKKTAAFPLRVLNYAARCFKRSAAIRGGVASNEQYHMCENDKRLIDSLSRMGPQNFIKGYNNVITKSSLQQGTALVMTPWDILNAQNEITSIHENLRSRLDLQSRHEALWNFYHGSELSPFDSQRLADMYGTNAIPVLINAEGSVFSQHDLDIFKIFQSRSCLFYGLGAALQLLGLYAASYDLGSFFMAPIEGAAEMFVNGFCLLAEKNVRQYPGIGQTAPSCYWAAVGFLRKSNAWRRILTVFGSKGAFSLGSAFITHSHELANGKISISDALKGEGIAAIGKGALSSLARFLQQYDSFVLLFLGETFDSLDTPWKEITSGSGVRKEPKVTPDLISASRTDVKRVAAQSRGNLEKFQTLLEAIINERNS